MYPACGHDTLSSNSLYLGKLHGKCATGDTRNAVKKVGRDLCAIVAEVAEDKIISRLLVNNEINKMSAATF